VLVGEDLVAAERILVLAVAFLDRGVLADSRRLTARLLIPRLETELEVMAAGLSWDGQDSSEADDLSARQCYLRMTNDGGRRWTEMREMMDG